ncbi:MAG: HDOD domain-containing protein [Pseudomonadales bacterium]
MAAQENVQDSSATRTLYVTAGSEQWQLLVPEQGLVSPLSLRDEMGRPVQISGNEPAGFDIQSPRLVDLSLSQNPEVLEIVAEEGQHQWVQCCELLPSAPTEHLLADDLTTIKHTVSRFTSRRIEARLHETLSLPPLPKTANDILSLSQNRNYDLADLVAVVEQDPALAARLVGWANSAYFAAPGSVQNISDAIVRVIGFDGTINMALSIALDEAVPTAPPAIPGLPDYWVEALLTAALTEHLASRLRQPDFDPGTAYLVGLLSGFGTLVLGHVFPPQFEQICQLQGANRHLLYTHCDEAVLGLSREMIGAALLDSWELPITITQAVRQQHDPTTDQLFAQLLRFSRALLAAEGLSSCPTGIADPTPDPRLELPAAAVASALELIREPLEELAALAAMFGGKPAP